MRDSDISNTHVSLQVISVYASQEDGPLDCVRFFDTIEGVSFDYDHESVALMFSEDQRATAFTQAVDDKHLAVSICKAIYGLFYAAREDQLYCELTQLREHGLTHCLVFDLI